MASYSRPSCSCRIDPSVSSLSAAGEAGIDAGWDRARVSVIRFVFLSLFSQRRQREAALGEPAADLHTAPHRGPGEGKCPPPSLSDRGSECGCSSLLRAKQHEVISSTETVVSPTKAGGSCVGGVIWTGFSFLFTLAAFQRSNRAAFL